MTSSHGNKRVIQLPLAPTKAELLKVFGAWSGSESGEAVAALKDSGAATERSIEDQKDEAIEVFHRREGETLELPLKAGSVVILGPANDPLRCRALPSQRELKAFKMPCDGILTLAPGVWFHESGQAPEAVEGSPPDLEERSYGEIFNMTFQVDENLKWQDPPKPVW
jgi:hypothetical protein